MSFRSKSWTRQYDTCADDKSDQRKIRGEISLAELLIAVADLPWKNQEQLKLIVQSLGFAIDLKEFEPDENHAKVIYDHHYYDSKARPKHKQKKPQLPPTAPPPPELPIELTDSAQVLDSNLKPRDDEEREDIQPDWLADAANFPALLPTEDSKAEPVSALPRENLFTDNTSRGILSAALATRRIGFEPDILRLIASMVRGDILREIPFEMTTTLDQGCQLLLDYNDVLTPYWPDLSNLAAQLKNVVGSERIEIYEFKNHPLDARKWISRKEHKAWQTETAKPVLVASNLGMLPNGEYDLNDLSLVNITEEWRQFVGQCKHNHVPLLILTPWANDNIPSGLGNYPILIHWNPKTSASMIRQLLGNGLKVKP